MFKAPKFTVRPGFKRRAIIAASCTALLSVGLAAYAWWRETPSMLQLLPDSTTMLVSVDAPWWWRTSSPIRERPTVKNELKDFEKVSSLSIEKDILPWAGKVGGAMLMGKSASPNFVGFFEVRDWASFGRCLTRVRKTAQGLGGGGDSDSGGMKMTWDRGAYHGVEIYTLDMAPGAPMVETTLIRDWFVVGQPVAVNSVIDTWEGRKPSLAKNALWSAALSKIPDSEDFCGGLNLGQLMSQSLAMNPNQKNATLIKKMQFVEAFSLADTGSGLRFDASVIPSSPEARAFFKNATASIHPVDPRALKQIPNDATAAMFSGGYLPAWSSMFNEDLSYLPAISGGAASNSLLFQRKENNPLFKLVTALKPFSQGMNISVVANHVNGVGLVFSGQTPSPAHAQKAAVYLNGILHDINIKTDTDAGVTSVDLENSGLKSDLKKIPFDISPAFKANDNLLRVVSSKKLLSDPVGQTSLVWPKEAKSSNSVMIGNFNFIEMIPHTHGVVKVLNTLKISGADWYGYNDNAADGSWFHGAFVINNWDYLNGVQAIANMIDSSAPSSK